MKKAFLIAVALLFLLHPLPSYAAEKDAACPPGFIQPTICRDSGVCCKSAGFAQCDTFSHSGIPLSCNAARLTWTAETAANYCPPDGQYYYYYDPTTKKCESMATTATYTCIGGSCQTAVGTVPTSNLPDFLAFVLKLAFYASGAIILFTIIATGYLVITGGGNPEKLQAAQENIIALFSGLALIVFSLVLLQAIGAGILGLPGF